jgi:hypothetical protein
MPLADLPFVAATRLTLVSAASARTTTLPPFGGLVPFVVSPVPLATRAGADVFATNSGLDLAATVFFAPTAIWPAAGRATVVLPATLAADLPLPMERLSIFLADWFAESVVFWAEPVLDLAFWT